MLENGIAIRGILFKKLKESQDIINHWSFSLIEKTEK